VISLPRRTDRREFIEAHMAAGSSSIQFEYLDATDGSAVDLGAISVQPLSYMTVFYLSFTVFFPSHAPSHALSLFRRGRRLIFHPFCSHVC